MALPLHSLELRLERSSVYASALSDLQQKGHRRTRQIRPLPARFPPMYPHATLLSGWCGLSSRATAQCALQRSGNNCRGAQPDPQPGYEYSRGGRGAPTGACRKTGNGSVGGNPRREMAAAWRHNAGSQMKKIRDDLFQPVRSNGLAPIDAHQTVRGTTRTTMANERERDMRERTNECCCGRTLLTIHECRPSMAARLLWAG